MGHDARMTTPTLLVFIHGACLGPWIWTHKLVPYFESRGLRCFAPDLHAAWPSPDWSSEVRRLTLARYVDRLHGLLGSWPGHRILIGHAMGARIAQGLVARGYRDGLVMIAPPAQEGGLQPLRALARAHPARFMRAWAERRPRLCFGPQGQPHEGAVRELLLHPGASAAQAHSVATALRDESFSACMQWLGRSPWPIDPQVPTLVLGGREDPWVPLTALRHTAAAWQATAHVIPHAGHCPMLGETGLSVARHIERWLFE